MCTTIEQSKKLIELGIDISSADLWWNFYSVTTNNTTPLIIHLDTPWIGNFNWSNKKDNIPAWSLEALLKLMPIINENTYKLYGTLDGGCVCEHPCTSIMFQEKTAIDAVFNMIIWLKKNNYL